MKKLINSHRIVIIRMVFLLTLVFTNSLYSQYIRVNRLWGGVNAAGGNSGVSYGNSNLNLFADYGAYGCRFQGGESFFGGWIGVAMDNWNGGKALFVPVDKYQTGTTSIVTPLVNYARYANPTYTVSSGGTTTSLPANDLGTGAVVDASKCIGTSDQTITVTNKYYCGVQVQRKFLAWTQDYHNNYTTIDLTFTNKSSQTFTNFYVFLHDGEYQFQRGDGNNPGISTVDAYAQGARRWYHYYGAKQNDSLRIFYNYSADDPEISGDRIGQPLTQQYGRLVDYDYTLVATLHASKQAYTPSGTIVNNIDKNDQDDMNQPSVTTYANLQNNLNLPAFSTITLDPASATAVSYYNLINGTTLANEDMTDADVRTLNGVKTHHRKNQDELGKAAPGAEPAISDASNSFESMVMCYGPYTFAPNQQIRIVKITGIAGLSRTKATEVGMKWYKSTLTEAPGLPNATTGYYPSNFVFPAGAVAKDLVKDRWVSTGIDSVHKTVSRAKYNFTHGYNAPATPPPPTKFTCTGAGSGIKLYWEDVAAESMSNFAGYRIMRKIGATDTTYYEQIYRSTSSDKAATHNYTDASVRVGTQYYYYIQALANVSSTDQNAHPTERGKTIASGRVYFYNNTAVSAEAPLGNTNAMDKIAIVPNPFNYNDPLLRGYGYTNPKDLRVTFYELPYTCTIKIFTEYGDLVKTLEHDQDSGKHEWNMVNEAGQTVASGVYIVVFQTPDGGISYQKLVVVR